MVDLTNLKVLIERDYSKVLRARNTLDNFPIYTKESVWQKGRHWSNGYVVGVNLLWAKLNKKTVPSLQIKSIVEELNINKKEKQFQDVGFISLYSECLAYELGINIDITSLKETVKYLEGCTLTDGSMIVSWKPLGYIGVDQFMNSMVLGWYALKFRDNHILNIYTKIIFNSVIKLIDGNTVYEYVDKHGNPQNNNSGSNEKTWLRGDAWAMVGISYAIYIFSRTKQYEIYTKLLSILNRLCKKQIELFSVYGYFPGSYPNDMNLNHNTLQDKSAEAAIGCALVFLKNKNILINDNVNFLLSLIGGNVEKSIGVKEHILNGTSYPLRLIDKENQCATWGDYYGLRYIQEMIDGTSKGGLDII
ncbi:hypothetical protein [Xenorhabdus bovienii]|uniref:hypothetical protein n=1 Tax=Xenorhabdus bovienii TaxID=40576 RepID=UPI003DA6AC64